MKNKLAFLIPFFLVLALFPFVNAVSFTNVTLNESIYINGTMSLDELSVTSTEIQFYNLTSNGKLTNQDTNPHTVYFYNLTSPYDDIRYDNDTIIVLDTTNYNFTIPALTTIKIGNLDGTDITIVNPKVGEDEKFLPIEFLITTTDSATCEIQIDSDPSQDMTTSDNLTFTYSEALENGLHNATFTCISGGYDSSEFIEFYVYKISSGDPDDGGGGGVDVIPGEVVRLDSLSIRHDDWYKNEKNAIYVYSYDENENFTDLTNITMFSIPEYDVEVSRLGEGVYKGLFSVGEVDEVTINITAIDGEKVLTQSVVIPLKTRTILEEINESVQLRVSKLFELLSDSLFWKIVLWIIILTILYLLIYLLRKDKKKSKK